MILIVKIKLFRSSTHYEILCKSLNKMCTFLLKDLNLLYVKRDDVHVIDKTFICIGLAK